MPRTTWVKDSLGCLVTATAVVVAGSSVALAQSPTTQPSPPEKDQPPAISLFDNKLGIGAKPNSVLDAWLSGVEMTCIGCGIFETGTVRREPTNRNAPWVLQGTWQRQTALGKISAGFVGMRNYAAPLYTAMPIGGDVDPAAFVSTGASAFGPASQWSLTAGLEKALVTRKSGATFGITADVLVPFSTGAVAASPSRVTGLTTPTVRAGFVFRW